MRKTTPKPIPFNPSVIEQVSNYEAWKKGKGEKILKKRHWEHAPVILMMLLDGIKESFMIEYISKELKLKNPKKVLRDYRSWAGAPDPGELHIKSPTRKGEVLEDLTKLWQRTLRVPYSVELLANWLPGRDIDYGYSDFDDKQTDEAASVKSKAEKKKKERLAQVVLGDAQRDALGHFASAFNILDSVSKMNLPMAPRTHCLMVAPSGSGKTFLAKTFAEMHDLPFFGLNVSAWMPLGSRAAAVNSTLVQLAYFVMTHPEGVIYLDELDKLNRPNSWTESLRLEIHNLLDSEMGVGIIDGLERRLRRRLSEDKVKELNQKLKRKFLIVGGGTWQEFWENQTTRSLGFNAEDQVKSLSKQELVKYVTPEILQRFNRELIVLPPLTRNDFIEMSRQMGERIAKSNPLGGIEVERNFLKAIDDGVDQAVQDKIGMRFIEECMSEGLLATSN